MKKKAIEHKKCVLIFSAAFVWNIPHSKQKKLKNLHRPNTNLSCFHEFTFYMVIKFFHISTSLAGLRNEKARFKVTL